MGYVLWMRKEYRGLLTDLVCVGVLYHHEPDICPPKRPHCFAFYELDKSYQQGTSESSGITPNLIIIDDRCCMHI